MLQQRVDGIILHPRIVSEKLKRRARWEYIGYLKDAVDIPVIGNGDVKTVDDCNQMFRETGCDAVMIGRTAIQKPWIFHDITVGFDRIPDPEEMLDAYRSVIAEIRNFFPESKAIGRIKEYTWYAAENMTFGHHFASRIQRLKSLSGLDETIEREFRKSC